MKLLEKSIILHQLFDMYQDLLTDKQKYYFEQYYFNDYSLTEISENKNVSRNAVHDQIKRTVSKLYDFETKLQLLANSNKRQQLLQQLNDINTDDEVTRLLDELSKVE